MALKVFQIQERAVKERGGDRAATLGATLGTWCQAQQLSTGNLPHPSPEAQKLKLVSNVRLTIYTQTF